MHPKQKRAWPYRFLRIFAVAVAAVFVIASLLIRVEQFSFRHRLEHLIADVRALEPGKSTADDVQRVVEKWDFKDASPLGQCSEDGCDYILQNQSPLAGILARFDGNPTVARILVLLGGRPIFVTSTLGLRDRAVRSIGLSLWVSAPRPSQPLYYINGTAGMKGRFLMGGSERSRPSKLLVASLRHKDYLVGKYTAAFNTDYGFKSYAPVTWVEFSSDADPKTIRRLMRFNLACVTRLRSCDQADLMPEVWSEIAADEHSPTASPTCTSEVIKRVEHLADAIAVVRVETPELESPAYANSPFRLSNASLIKPLNWPDRSRRELGSWIEIDNPEMMITADTGVRVHAGGQYIFFLQQHAYGTHPLFALYPCGVLTSSQDNLDMVQHDAPTPIN